MSIALSLAGEVAVLRDRLDTLERLLEGGKPVTRGAIDEYKPDAGVRAARDEWRQTFLSVVLRSIHQELEALQTGEGDAYTKAIELVEKESS